MQRRGKRCAVLDADITGPSMGHNLGVNGKAKANEIGILPLTAPCGLEVLSANMFLKNDSDPVVWRGPLLAGMVKQFWSDAIWTDIDFMFVDMPVCALTPEGISTLTTSASCSLICRREPVTYR